MYVNLASVGCKLVCEPAGANSNINANGIAIIRTSQNLRDKGGSQIWRFAPIFLVLFECAKSTIYNTILSSVRVTSTIVLASDLS